MAQERQMNHYMKRSKVRGAVGNLCHVQNLINQINVDVDVDVDVQLPKKSSQKHQFIRAIFSWCFRCVLLSHDHKYTQFKLREHTTINIPFAVFVFRNRGRHVILFRVWLVLQDDPCIRGTQLDPTDRFGKLSVRKVLSPLQFSKRNFHFELS